MAVTHWFMVSKVGKKAMAEVFMNWTLTETLEVEIQPQVSDLDSDLTCPKISVGLDPGFCSDPIRTQWNIKYSVCPTLLTAFIHCSAETVDMKTSTTCPGQPGQAPVGSFNPLEEMERWPDPGCSACAYEHAWGAFGFSFWNERQEEYRVKVL